MVKTAAAVMLKESDLADHNKVLDCLVQLLTSHERLAAMSAAALTLAHPQAAQEIAERLVSLATN
jgi:UDP-N-acetylglucosamine:LPS N-acetylglucosamine transferase